MTERSLTQHAAKEIAEIHALSKDYNGSGGDHRAVLLELVSEHAQEIEQLYALKDQHADIETGDLLVLCLELLLESGKDPDEIIEKCYRRYKEKLQGLIREQGGEDERA